MKSALKAEALILCAVTNAVVSVSKCVTLGTFIKLCVKNLQVSNKKGFTSPLSQNLIQL